MSIVHTLLELSMTDWFCLDIIGVVKNTDDLRTMMSKASKELKKRDVTLVDESQVQVRLTLWGSDVCWLFFHLGF
jgi:ssDNA-binding replication factor A large subunit